MLSLAELDAAAHLVHGLIGTTPQYRWPLLCERVGTEVWVKHENHTPTGAFKVRGGLVLLDALRRQRPAIAGIVSATRGNHGQSMAYAAGRLGLRTVIVVPHGNSREKNAAMRAWGAELIEHGADFDAAREHAAGIAEREGLAFVGPFRRELVAGVASYALELFRALAGLDTVYVPIGCGSGICGLISARDALGLSTEIVGVVAEGAPAYSLSFDAGRPVETERALTMADGMAVRVPVPEALEVILRGAARIVRVSDAAIAAAIRHFYSDTHNLAEGAGAAALAALIEDPQRRGARHAVILSGGNIDRDQYANVITAA
jgi:threonine dehydratase